MSATTRRTMTCLTAQVNAKTKNRKRTGDVSIWNLQQCLDHGCQIPEFVAPLSRPRHMLASADLNGRPRRPLPCLWLQPRRDGPYGTAQHGREGGGGGGDRRYLKTLWLLAICHVSKHAPSKIHCSWNSVCSTVVYMNVFLLFAIFNWVPNLST